MTVLCILAAAVSLAAALRMYQKTGRVLTCIDQMLESAVDGTFEEKEFTEDKMSRLEARMYRYLSMGNAGQKQLKKERDTIRTLVSDISHQTKTPIANLLLYGQLLEEQKLDDGAGSIIKEIRGQTEKLNFLIQSLVKLSRLENGIMEVKPEKNCIQDLLKKIGIPAYAGEKGVDVYVQEEIPKLYAFFDFKWTLEALVNILDNGIKYTQEGGRVTLSVQAYEMFVRIDIADTGIGISEEDMARIFARFYRGSAVRQEEGAGLGLYLAREILSREGGYIKVSSKVGEGSVFSVFLPKEQNLSKL